MFWISLWGLFKVVVIYVRSYSWRRVGRGVRGDGVGLLGVEFRFRVFLEVEI